MIEDGDNYALDADYWWAGENTDDVDQYLYVHNCSALSYSRHARFSRLRTSVLIGRVLVYHGCCCRFAHGSNYRQALSDFVLIGGRVPMVPRYSVGMFTRLTGWC